MDKAETKQLVSAVLAAEAAVQLQQQRLHHQRPPRPHQRTLRRALHPGQA
jgi:hypothetical protein